MFEGQNIHLSPVDGKRLCSFSQKICKQHRLNGFAFCIRHILEDKNSPFKQCQYKTKANGERCFNPVPEALDRVYCSSHLQVLGMIPKNPSKQCHDKKKVTALKGKSKKDNALNNKKHSHCTEKNISQKLNKNARKILGEDYEKVSKVKTSWYAVMTKLFKKTANNLHTWQKQCLDTEVNEFLKSRKYQKQNEGFFRSHVIDDDDSSNGSEEGTNDVFQSVFLDLNERVHHNLLCVEQPPTQEEKMGLKLKHCNRQLRQAVASSVKRSNLSYSVLSKLVSSARKSTAQTANVLNVENGATSFGSFHLHRERNESISYQVPCAMLSMDVCCKKMAMPYTKYCIDHISIDDDQHLFTSNPTFGDVNDPLQTLHFLHDGGGEAASTSSTTLSLPSLMASGSSQCKRKGESPSASQSKRSCQRLKPSVEEKRLKKKKSKTKRKPSKRPVNSMRDELQKKFDIPTQPPQKMNAHIKKTITEEKSEVMVKQEDEMFNNSNSEEDDADILTPEEAFHLPPGSLSFSPRMVDDDSMPAMQNRNCSLDEEDDELIRCSTNFPFEPNNQLPRDIGSPTLNQLSSSDFASSFNNINNIFISPAKALDSTSPPINPNTTTLQQSYNTTVCRPNSSSNHVNNRLTHSTPPVAGMVNEQKSGSTLLKISHVDMFNKTGEKMDHETMFTPKQHSDDRNIRSGNSFDSISGGVQDNKMHLQYRNNGIPPVNNQQITVGNESINSFPHVSNGIVNRSHNISIKETISYDQTSLSKRYLSDSLLLQQPLSQDNTLFDDINTDVESPLEKVNPDIFFSSVFPVSTSTGSI